MNNYFVEKAEVEERAHLDNKKARSPREEMKVPEPRRAHDDNLDFFGKDKNISRQKPGAAKQDGYVPSAVNIEVVKKEAAERQRLETQ